MDMKTGAALLLIGAMQVRTEAESFDLEQHLARAITNKVYQAPSSAELAQGKDLFQRALQGQLTGGELRTNALPLGFEAHEILNGRETLWLLCETPGAETGRGWYLLRTNRQSTILLEAPHARNDIRTGLIGLRMFLAGRSRAFAAATITRHRADMAHLDDTLFQAFTLAFARSCPAGLVVQLHGFESGNHRDTEAAIIASDGTRSPEPWLADLMRRLKTATSLPILAYPTETQALGATLNAQARGLRQDGGCRFLHLELSMDLRERLASDDELRRGILDCLSSDR